MTAIDEIFEFFSIKGILILAVVFMPLERILPMHRDQAIFRHQWTVDFVYLLLNGLLIRGCMLLVVAALALTFDQPWIHAMQEAVRHQPVWLQAIEAIVLADLGFYWAHRALHRYPALWRFHAIHHSIKDLDWVAGHRVHFLDQTLVKTASILPLLLFGFSEWALAPYLISYQWQSVLLHSNVAIGFGPLNRLVASPVFHRWHHANQPEAFDKNFSGQLSLWDYLFGTAYCPRDRRPVAYGIPDPVPSGFFAQLLYPLRRTPASTVGGARSATAATSGEG